MPAVLRIWVEWISWISPFNYSSSSICPCPLSGQVQTPPQFELLLLIFDSFSFIPIPFSPSPIPNLTHPLAPSYCQYTYSSKWNLCPLDSVRTRIGVFCSFLATSQLALVVKNPSANARDSASILGVGKIPQRKQWQPTLVFLPGKSHGQRSLVGYSQWSCKELDTTEWLNTSTRWRMGANFEQDFKLFVFFSGIFQGIEGLFSAQNH